MKHIVLFITILSLSVGISFGKDHALIDSGNFYYTNAKYEQAIVTYETILNDGFESAELYYNLGNAYYKSNKIAYGIVNYERSLKLDPSDSDAKFNLRLANTHVVDKIDVIPQFFLSSWLTRLIMLFDSNIWAIVSMSLFVVGLALLLLFFLSDAIVIRKVAFWVGILLLIVSLVSFNFSRKQKWMQLNEPDAIVLTPSVVVKSSPDESGTQLFIIHEGLKVTITDELGDWVEIRLSDGNEGWLKETNLVVI